MRPPFEPQPDALVPPAEVRGRVLAEGDHALGRVLDRRVEELAAGHVACARRRSAPPRPASESVRSVSGRRCARARRRRSAPRSGASARPPRPSRAGRPRTGRPRSRRREPRLLRERLGRERTRDPRLAPCPRRRDRSRRAPAARSARRRARRELEPAYTFSAENRITRASISLRVRTSLGAGTASSSSGASSAQIGLERDALEVREREPNERVGAAPCDRTDELLDERPRKRCRGDHAPASRPRRRANVRPAVRRAARRARVARSRRPMIAARVSGWCLNVLAAAGVRRGERLRVVVDEPFRGRG